MKCHTFSLPAAAALLLLALASAGGCDAVSLKGGSRTLVQTGEWPFAPESMRVHPFTALAQQNGRRVLEVRIELLDQLGDVTKGVGDWRFELYAQPGRTRSRERLEVWEAEMNTLEQNERHYDPITRTYAFNLRVVEPLPDDAPLSVVAQLTDLQGRRLLAEGEVTRQSSE